MDHMKITELLRWNKSESDEERIECEESGSAEKWIFGVLRADYVEEVMDESYQGGKLNAEDLRTKGFEGVAMAHHSIGEYGAQQLEEVKEIPHEWEQVDVNEPEWMIKSEDVTYEEKVCYKLSNDWEDE
mmetsp:Transcript_23100/g.66310  ORF Transcript_23100/g.66310 Transcript_23100/m.66310 type:complete len:129 (+) Transcript_23100:95-481(+)